MREVKRYDEKESQRLMLETNAVLNALMKRYDIGTKEGMENIGTILLAAVGKMILDYLPEDHIDAFTMEVKDKIDQIRALYWLRKGKE